MTVHDRESRPISESRGGIGLRQPAVDAALINDIRRLTDTLER
jgi:hypothetical protein